MTEDETKRAPVQQPAPKKSNWLVAVVIVGAAVAIYVVARRPKPPTTAPAGEAAGDHGDPYAGMNAVHAAIMAAPEGATSCETAWNAFDAMERALAAAGQPSSVEKRPDRQAFLDVCAGFTDIEQRCLSPRFKDVNRDRCEAEAQGVWSEPDSLRRKNLFTILGRRAATVKTTQKGQSPPALDAGGD